MKNSNPHILPGSRVAVLGYGVTGRAAVRYALSCGAVVMVSDSREEGLFADSAKELSALGVCWEAGGHRSEFFDDVDMVLVSAGISPQSSIIQQLRQRNIPIYGELAIAAPILQQREATVIAITGSNGKTTVTSLLGEVLRTAGNTVFIGGNIGTPLYEYCRQQKEYQFVVVEVSSFQLENLGDFAPDVAILLNISPDHLDWHGGMDNYIAAKMALFRNQRQGQLAILPRQYCGKGVLASSVNAHSFGRDMKDSVRIDGEQLLWSEESGGGVITLPQGAIGFAAENFAAAALALRWLTISEEKIEQAFTEFKRPPHRLELVAELAGVLYINDSKATNTGSVIGALQQQVRSVILIAGGRGKGEDYTLLSALVREKVRDLIVLGEAAAEIEAALRGDAVIHTVASLEAAVMLAGRLAVAGDVVLLSPACASFDMFSGYNQRGECFRRAVAELASMEKGEEI